MINSPRFLLGVGLIFLLMGWLIPVLIILYVIPSTLFLNFLGWALSVSGLFLGFIGAAMLGRVDQD
jgi:hypothetical protein